MLSEIYRRRLLPGVQKNFLIEKILNQSSDHLNWQHGDIYVTPSQLSAVRYACSGAEFGGELLDICGKLMKDLREINEEYASEISEKYKILERFLIGGGQPILVEYCGVDAANLRPEVTRVCLDEEIRSLSALGFKELNIVAQQTNFRLMSEIVEISSIYKISIMKEDDYFPQYELLML